ncbi:patatin-like protein [Saccharothrix sp.]|uniref:patatin-like protein n=1 Tax=Saccharothrix sp. TaxID=1873460 RepID=UPI0028114FFC|nr:patatin-like protein [Saccharothrix sp.]
MPVEPEEIRFAVVLNGGVSLAVWMGGAVLELDRLTRGTSVYGKLLDMVGCKARADVISGTSAGGINGAALALSQVNANARLDELRGLWSEQGRMEQLLRTPFAGQPVSLLRGDEFFLPRLREALERLVADHEPTRPEDRPIDLRITTTVLDGVPQPTFDDLGQPLTQYEHRCTFTFRRDHPLSGRKGEELQPRDDFRPEDLRARVAQLALAARSSASFPFAFEPSYVPVNGTAGPDRPDMRAFASWADRAGTDRSRFAVDGGLLANTPTTEALEAIDRMPAGGPVRRVMLLVFPHAELPGDEPAAADPDFVPSTLGTGGRLLAALRNQGTKTYVDKIEEHNRVAASRRGSRDEVLDRLADEHGRDPTGPTVPERLYSLVDALHPHYQDLRIRRAARDIVTRQLDVVGSNTERWPFERVRQAAESAQRDRLTGREGLPYVPAQPPPHVADDLLGRHGWRWGFTIVDGIAAAVMELTERLLWVVPTDQPGPLARATERIGAARLELHWVRDRVRALRTERDRPWVEAPAARLDFQYWRDRLEAFADDMIGDDETIVGNKVRAEVDTIGRVAADACSILFALDDDQRKAGGLTPWYLLLLEPKPAAESALAQSPLDLPGLTVDQATEAAQKMSDSQAGFAKRQAAWLSRLLALEVATACLADESPTGLDRSVELIQLSLHTDNDFAEYSRTSDDKAGGMALGRFGGFLKRSWRVNDWIWGRLDAATMLCRVLCDQRRLRRVADLDRQTVGSDVANREQVVEERARTAVDGLVVELFGGVPEGEKKIEQAIEGAVRELERVYDGTVEPVDLEPVSRNLATLAAWGLQARIAVEELPHLKVAVEADLDDGSDTRSNGARFVREHRTLLDELAKLDPELPATARDKGVAALRAFDRAAVGREPLGQEISSDQAIRTAATAAAVAVTVVDSDNSGLGGVKAVRPITRGLRGAALLPYWAVVGLTRGGPIARFLAMLALGGGGLALVLALLGVLRDGPGSVAAAVGGATLLAAFGYAALRSGSLLHGLVLLTPVLPLAAHALQVSLHGGPGGPTLPAASSFLLITLTVGGLLVIGSLRAPLRTPLGVLANPRRRPGRPAVTRRPAGAVAAMAVAVVGYFAIAAVVRRVPVTLWIVGGCVLVAVVFGVVMAWVHGRRLQRRLAGPDGTWVLESAFHPAAVTAGWALVYGALYGAAILVLIALEPGTDPADGGVVGRWVGADWWALTALVTAAVAALVLVLVTPWFVPGRARRRLRQDLVDEATVSLYPSPTRVTSTLLVLLEGRGLLYRYLVDESEGGLALARRGTRIATLIRAGLWPPDPATDGAENPESAARKYAEALRSADATALWRLSFRRSERAAEALLKRLDEDLRDLEVDTVAPAGRGSALAKLTNTDTEADIRLRRRGSRWYVDVERCGARSVRS